MNESIPKFTLHLGDCLDIMDHLETNSIDTCITDPPYGLKFMGKEWDHGVPGVPFWRKIYRLLKPGGSLLAFGGTRTHHRLMVAIEDSGFEIRDCLMWLYGSGFPKSHDISKAIDKAAGVEREVIGQVRRWGNAASGGRGGQRANDYQPSILGAEKYDDITAPATSVSQLWDGWGTALKPAWEPIIVAMKPREGTFVNNALKYRVAGLNIDGSRIESKDVFGGGSKMLSSGKTVGTFDHYEKDGFKQSGKGRWPSNLLLDEQAAELLDEQAGRVRSAGIYKGRNTNPREGFLAGNQTAGWGYADKGGASRFFYCAKASRKERGEGNNHPTVKPLALMRYLCKLTATPTGGVVFDPFMGSGSTGVACILEGRDFIGIEIDPGYWKIAWERIDSSFIPQPV